MQHKNSFEGVFLIVAHNRPQSKQKVFPGFFKLGLYFPNML
jgi:hypothetical protein